MLALKPRRIDAQSELGIRGAGTLRFYLGGRGRHIAANSGDELKRAAEELETACRTEPEAALARAALAMAQLDISRRNDDTSWLERAEASGRAAVKLDDRRPEPHRTLGWVLSAMKKPEESLAEFGRAAELDPTDDVARLRLARTHESSGTPSARRKSIWPPSRTSLTPTSRTGGWGRGTTVEARWAKRCIGSGR